MGRTTQQSKKYICYVDGGCYNNGAEDAEGYGSYSIYLLHPQQQQQQQSQQPPQQHNPYAFTPNPNDRMHEIQILKERINPNDPKHRANLTLIHNNARFPIFPHEGKMSNNIAELVSLKVLIRKLENKRILLKNQETPSVVIYMDSKLTINQYTGMWQVKNSILRDIHAELRYIIEQASIQKSFIIGWIPNELMKDVLGH